MAVSTVGPGKDYSTLSAWEAVRPATYTEDVEAECYSMSDTTIVTGAGSTPGIYRTKIYSVASEDPKGVWSTSAYRLEVTATANSQRALDWQEVNCDITKLQVKIISAAYSNNVAIRTSAADNHVSKCIVVGVLSGTASGTPQGIQMAGGGSVKGCAVYDFTFGAVACRGITGANATADIYNNVVINCYNGIYRASGTIKAVNNIVQDANTDYTGTFAAGSDYNIDEDGTAPGGNSVTATLTFNNKAGDDFHLASGDTDAIGAGIGPSSDASVPTLDVDGDTRSGTTCDIGFDESVSAGVSILPFMMNYQ
jgi:hypothetical protein